MAIKCLIVLGLAIIPFFQLAGYDTREPKMALALAFAFAVSLFAIYYGKLKPLRNKWLLLFVGYLLLSVYLAPKPDITLWNMQVSNFWVWQPMFCIIVFMLFFLTMASLDFTDRDKRLMLNVMTWTGFVMAVYVFIQFLNIDQMFTGGNTIVGRIGGTLGNRTIVAPFIAMLIPIAIYLKRYWKALAMTVAVCLTLSAVGIGAMVVSLAVLFATRGRKQFMTACAVLLVIGIMFGAGYSKNPEIKTLMSNSSRFGHWQQITKDINSPLVEDGKKKYPWTGLGMGSFKYVYSVKHRNDWRQAHNEYLELAYNTGIIGLILFLCAIGYMFKTNFSFKDVWKGKADRYRMSLLASFICIAICAGGTFIFQLAPHNFSTIVIVGLLSNRNRKRIQKGDSKCSCVI